MREVAHDYQPQVKKYVEKEVQYINSFDTCHGTYVNLCMYMYVNILVPRMWPKCSKRCVGKVAQRRRTPMKVLVEKTYRFTQNVWSLYIQRNKTDIR